MKTVHSLSKCIHNFSSRSDNYQIKPLLSFGEFFTFTATRIHHLLSSRRIMSPGAAAAPSLIDSGSFIGVINHIQWTASCTIPVVIQNQWNLLNLGHLVLTSKEKLLWSTDSKFTPCPYCLKLLLPVMFCKITHVSINGWCIFFWFRDPCKLQLHISIPLVYISQFMYIYITQSITIEFNFSFIINSYQS